MKQQLASHFYKVCVFTQAGIFMFLPCTLVQPSYLSLAEDLLIAISKTTKPSLN